MADTKYVTQDKSISVDYEITNIAGDGTTWNPITVPAGVNCIGILANARADNDAVFTHMDDQIEFHFAKTSTPGINFLHSYGFEIATLKEPGDVIGYVRSANTTFVSVMFIE